MESLPVTLRSSILDQIIAELKEKPDMCFCCGGTGKLQTKLFKTEFSCPECNGAGVYNSKARELVYLLQLLGDYR